MGGLERLEGNYQVGEGLTWRKMGAKGEGGQEYIFRKKEGWGGVKGEGGGEVWEKRWRLKQGGWTHNTQTQAARYQGEIF